MLINLKKTLYIRTDILNSSKRMLAKNTDPFREEFQDIYWPIHFTDLHFV